MVNFRLFIIRLGDEGKRFWYNFLFFDKPILHEIHWIRVEALLHRSRRILSTKRSIVRFLGDHPPMVIGFQKKAQHIALLVDIPGRFM